jgi:hypothetical protein
MRRETAGGAGRDETRCAPMLSTLALVFKSLALRAGSLQRLRERVAARSSRPGSRQGAASAARTRRALSRGAGPRRGVDGGGDGARRARTDQPNVDHGFTDRQRPRRVVVPARARRRQASPWLTQARQSGGQSSAHEPPPERHFRLSSSSQVSGHQARSCRRLLSSRSSSLALRSCSSSIAGVSPASV